MITRINDPNRKVTVIVADEVVMEWGGESQVEDEAAGKFVTLTGCHGYDELEFTLEDTEKNRVRVMSWKKVGTIPAKLLVGDGREYALARCHAVEVIDYMLGDDLFTVCMRVDEVVWTQ